MFNWKYIILGIIFSFLIYGIIYLIIGDSNFFIGLITATLIVGYLVDDDLKNGATNGVMVGLLGYIISFIYSLLIHGMTGINIMSISIIIAGIIIFSIIGALGGAIGVLIKKQRN